METLAFVDEVGMTLDGGYLYRFDFTEDSDVVWGDFFNVVPSALIPMLQVDRNCISKTGKVVFPKKMLLAKKSYCFSMQDCIDGILPLIYTEIDGDALMVNDTPFFLRFGETFDNVIKKLSEFKLEITDLEEVEHGDNTAIGKLIDLMDNNDDNEEK